MGNGNLIEAIKEVQGLNHLSDRQFAIRLKIDPSTWSLIKRGKASVGMKFLNALLREFPELKLTVYKYIAEGDGDGIK